MDRFPVIVLQPPVWSPSQTWAPLMTPIYVSSRDPSPTPSGMSPRAKAFTIDALLSRNDHPVSPSKSPVSILLGSSHDASFRKGPGKLKRNRTVFSESQLQRLEGEFQRQQYLVGLRRRQLAKDLALNDLQLKVWFQNRRIKWRKKQRMNDESISCSSSSDSE